MRLRQCADATGTVRRRSGLPESNESLLSGILRSLLDHETDLGPILLKVRYLAKRLGSDDLEQWVIHEAEGYPQTESKYLGTA